jgi:hypothetical protein
MDIKQILLDKKKKLQELKKQRALKEQEITSQLENQKVIASEEDIPTNKLEHPDEEEILPNEQEQKNLTSLDINKIDLIIPPLEKFDFLTSTEIESTIDTEELTIQLKRDLEKSIRKELEEKYKQLYENTVKDLKPEIVDNLQSSPTETKKIIKYPTTKVKQISISENSLNTFLTLHDDSITIWNIKDNEIFIIDQIHLFSQVNFAIFDSKEPNKIISAYETGYIHITNLDDSSEIQTAAQLAPIISIHQSSTSIIAFCSKGDYLVFANNLIDELIPKKNIFTSSEFTSNLSNFQLSDSNLSNLVISSCTFINSNSAIISLLTGEMLLIDFGSYNVSLLYKPQNNPLPAMSISYNSGKVLILGLDHTLNIISISTGTKIVEPVYISHLAFFVEWINPDLFVSCSVQNQVTVWKIDNEKIIKVKQIEHNTDTDEKPLISSLKVINTSKILIGDLEGGNYIINVN